MGIARHRTALCVAFAVAIDDVLGAISRQERELIADDEQQVDDRRAGRGELVPQLRPQSLRGIPAPRKQRERVGLDHALGKLPAEKARKRPLPCLLSALSARIERTELPVQKNRTLTRGGFAEDEIAITALAQASAPVAATAGREARNPGRRRSASIGA